MYTRIAYLEKIKPFINKPVIKIITGMRRVGKSFFLKQIIETLIADHKIKQSHILYINKESLEFDFLKNYQDLNQYVKKSFHNVQGKKFLLIDEIQEIQNWEKAAASFFTEGDIDIYLTGSNAHLLSSEIATLLSGRYIEFPIFSLSFREFLLFQNKKTGEEKDFENYLKFGGFPAIHSFELNEETTYQYINAIYNTILLKDVIKRNQIRNLDQLENIARFTFDNVGNIFSAKKIADYLKSQKIKIGVETVQNYLSYLSSAFLLYKAPRFDIKGKRILEIYEKYFLGDVSLKHALLGYKKMDISGLLENIVFLELKRRGFNVFIGKIDDKEVDFIAEKQEQKIYFQVAYLLSSPETIQREFGVLQSIKDNYPKFVLSMDKILGKNFEGIKHLNIIDFLMDSSIK